MEFYPIFTETYKRRDKLYPQEFIILSKMRNYFDRIYPYTAHLNSLIQDKIFLNANFSDLSESIKAYYEKANDNLGDLKKIIFNYHNLLKKEEKSLILKQKEDEKDIKLKQTGNLNNTNATTIVKRTNLLTVSNTDDMLMISQSILWL